MLRFVFNVSIQHQSCLGFLVNGPFSLFAKLVRNIVKMCACRRYTLVHLVRPVRILVSPGSEELVQACNKDTISYMQARNNDTSSF